MGIFERILEPKAVGVAEGLAPFDPAVPPLSLLRAVLGVSITSRRNCELFMIVVGAVIQNRPGRYMSSVGRLLDDEESGQESFDQSMSIVSVDGVEVI